MKRSKYKIHVRQKRKVRELNNELTLDDNFIGVLLLCSKLDSIERIREHLRPYYDLLVHLYEDEQLIEDQDYRTGSDTYGYASIESVQCNLSYISGRWRCCFRVRWLIELINPDYKLYEGQFGQL